MAYKQNFPSDIRNAIETACRDAQPPRYGVNFIHMDTGEPTASVGRLSGGLHALGVYDDFIVGQGNGNWSVWSNRGELIGVYGIAETLRVGLANAIAKLYCKRVKRGARTVRSRESGGATGKPVEAVESPALPQGGPA